MKQWLRIFSHLERKHKLTLCMDPSLPAVDELIFSHDTLEFLECHWDAKEESPRAAEIGEGQGGKGQSQVGPGKATMAEE